MHRKCVALVKMELLCSEGRIGTQYAAQRRPRLRSNLKTDRPCLFPLPAVHSRVRKWSCIYMHFARGFSTRDISGPVRNSPCACYDILLELPIVSAGLLL